MAGAAPRVAVFRGTRAACCEHGLVLEAKGLAYDLVELDGMWALLVPPAAVDLARDELTRYATERGDRPGGAGRPSSPSAVPRSVPPDLCDRAAADGVLRRNPVVRHRLAGVGRARCACRRRVRMVARRHGADPAFGSSALARAICCSAPASASWPAGCFGPGVAWASIVAAGAAANYLDMLISPPRASRSRRFHRGVCRPGTACRLLPGASDSRCASSSDIAGRRCSRACACWRFWAPAASTSMCSAMRSDSWPVSRSAGCMRAPACRAAAGAACRRRAARP